MNMPASEMTGSAVLGWYLIKVWSSVQLKLQRIRICSKSGDVEAVALTNYQCLSIFDCDGLPKVAVTNNSCLSAFIIDAIDLLINRKFSFQIVLCGDLTD